jgi:MFS transporter, DHA2 family, multidrug resistance protein
MTLIARQQGTVMGFADVFLMLTVLFVALAGMTLILRKPAPPAAGAGSGH